ncbi:deoxyhypusine hydroxylase [Chloropicon primus]|uniref:Deoxyhypusine hydroxylase n=1 Tax=Chloropicon primus TaxID=1764295 RepID=A0A5B8N0U0_9CHLO|nr:deoxyhypusine hydroxylase [Chloropicon primus]UPR04732.1 deoxyhypusine hydroxylase [Chloropicon primus]|eukprot:QDZ25535.1 deoxyhypusine hydroxylase [Chloropicon primus]
MEKKHGALLRHEVAYVLGQMRDGNEEVVEGLRKVLRDTEDDVMVRHEAAEALGAIGIPQMKQVLEEHLEDASREVAETCELALRRIVDEQKRKVEEKAEGGESVFNTVDPTLVSEEVQNTDAEKLEALALDESANMHDRYEAIFAVRNKGGKQAVDLMAKCLEQSKSALLKHEVAFVLGQLQNTEATDVLIKILRDEREHPMVRHEAAEALGSVAEKNKDVLKLLEDYCGNECLPVAQSCMVALDMLENQEDFEYCEALN